MTTFTFEKINSLGEPAGLQGSMSGGSHNPPQTSLSFGATAFRESARAANGKGFWHRFFDAMCEARLQAAQREIRRLNLDARHDM